MHRAAVIPRVRALPRPPRLVLWVAAAVVALGIAFLLVRESAVVRVDEVTITGLSGPDAPRVRQLLTETARDMTTLHVDEDQLRAVVEPFPTIAGIDIATDFPHGMRITIHENLPVAVVVVAGRRTPVAADGTLMPSAAQRRLPSIPLEIPQGGDRLTDRTAMTAVRILAAAPGELRARIARVDATSANGFVFELTSGLELRFGAADRLAAKWASAVAVLADASSRGATYVDVRYPERPAAGGLEDPADQSLPEASNAVPAPEGDAAAADTMATPQ